LKEKFKFKAKYFSEINFDEHLLEPNKKEYLHKKINSIAFHYKWWERDWVSSLSLSMRSGTVWSAILQ
jgi:hypothetical protein